MGIFFGGSILDNSSGYQQPDQNLAGFPNLNQNQ
jgi:hypothetical protein